MEYIECWCCGKICAVTSKNWIRKHKARFAWASIGGACAGSGTRPNTVIDTAQRMTDEPTA